MKIFLVTLFSSIISVVAAQVFHKNLRRGRSGEEPEDQLASWNNLDLWATALDEEEKDNTRLGNRFLLGDDICDEPGEYCIQFFIDGEEDGAAQCRSILEVFALKASFYVENGLSEGIVTAKLADFCIFS